MSRTNVKLRYRFFYAATRAVMPLILRKYGFTTNTLEKTDEPYIVISNHLTELDAFMLSTAFPKQMYYVAGEHFLHKCLGRVFRFINGTIFEYKGSVALNTVREIIRRVREGGNVMIFAEGCRSFNGETLTLPESAGKLVKSAGGGLVTYRFEGAYFVAPRWAKYNRIGPMRGSIIRHYSRDEIREMSVGELTEAINHDIHENAYERQRRDMYEYRGINLAEGLENYLIKCSSCGAIDSMKTEGDSFECTCCGQKGIYNKFGFLEGEGLRFDSVYDWGVWSEKEIEREIQATDTSEPVFTDDDLILFELTTEHRKEETARGRLEAYRDRLVFKTESSHEQSSGSDIFVFNYSGIPPMEMMFGQSLLMSYDGRHYEITGTGFHALKYTILHKAYDR